MDSNKNREELKGRNVKNHSNPASLSTTQTSTADVNVCHERKDGGDKSDTKTLLIIFTSLVIDLLAFTVILPLLPSLLEFYGRQKEVKYAYCYVNSIKLSG